MEKPNLISEIAMEKLLYLSIVFNSIQTSASAAAAVERRIRVKRFITKVIQACSLMKMENGKNYQILFIFPSQRRNFLSCFVAQKYFAKLMRERKTQAENILFPIAIKCKAVEQQAIALAASTIVVTFMRRCG